MLITLLCTVVELITFQTEKAKLMSGTLSRVSSSSISTAEDQSRSQSGKKNDKADIYNMHADGYTDHQYQSQGMVVACCASDCLSAP